MQAPQPRACPGTNKETAWFRRRVLGRPEKSAGVWLLEEEEKAWLLWKSLDPQELDVGRGLTTGRMASISGEQEIHAGSGRADSKARTMGIKAMRIGRNLEEPFLTRK